MRFTLTQDQIAFRRKAAESFLAPRASWPAYPADRVLAPDPSTDQWEADQFGPLVKGAWDGAPVAGDDRLLRGALVAEAAGGACLVSDVGELITLSWLAAQSPAVGAVLAARPHLAAFSCSAVGPTAQLRRVGRDYQLSGHCQVLRMRAADRVLLPADHNGRIVLASVDPAGPGMTLVERYPVATGTSLLRLDFTFHRLASDQVVSMPTTMRSLADLRALGRVLSAAELVGIMQWALDSAVNRARARRQFGRPIGAFQAIAHQCADMLCTVELCRSLVYAAAASHEGTGLPDHRLAALAWLLVWHESLRVLTTALHVFGADGLRWSEAMHLQLRRCQLLRQLWGTACEVADETTTYMIERAIDTAR